MLMLAPVAKYACGNTTNFYQHFKNPHSFVHEACTRKRFCYCFLRLDLTVLCSSSTVVLPREEVA